MTPGEFYLDGLDRRWSGFDTGERWNGWACPMFSMETLVEILSSLEGTIEHAFDGGILWQDPDGEPEFFAPERTDHGALYAMPGWSFHESAETDVCERCRNVFAAADMTTDRDGWYCQPCYEVTHG